MKREVAIIGCGPAGLLAAHAAVLCDYAPTIYALKAEPSPNARAVFLHRPIPDLCSAEPDAEIRMVKRGTSHGYAQKVYGDPEAATSWEKFGAGVMPAWALAAVYGELWHLYSGVVRECEVNYGIASAISEEFPLVINTAPLPALCEGSCSFPSRRIWVRDGAAVGVMENQMVYSGSPLDAWYRSSDLFGVESTEFSHWVKGAREGMKVLDTDCDCLPQIVRAGRWGTWRAGVLLHHAYKQAVDALRPPLRGWATA